MKSYVIAGVLLATIGTSAVSAADLRPVAERPIRIQAAVYGDLASQKVCNAGAAVAALCDGHPQCVLPVSNALCGDPAFLTVKQIHIDYTCGRRPRSVDGIERGTVDFGCQ